MLLLVAYKFLYKRQTEKVEVNFVTQLQTHPHIWKHPDTYYKLITKESARLHDVICYRIQYTGHKDCLQSLLWDSY